MKMYQSPRFEAVELLSAATMQATSAMVDDGEGGGGTPGMGGEAPRRSLIPGFTPKAL